MRLWFLRLWNSFSATGLLVGTLLFAASLTPSLVPRNYLTQGVLSGICLAIGYGIGILLLWTWVYLQLPRFNPRLRRISKAIGTVICLVILLTFLWRTAEWQNSIRTLMHMKPVETAHPYYVAALAFTTFVFLIALARLFKLVLNATSLRTQRIAPKRISYLVGGIVAVILFWTAAEGVLFRFGLHTMDSSFRALDELIVADTPKPTDPLKTGSSASLVSWQDLGRQGRSFISTGPTKDDIAQFRGQDAKEPIRVYVGLNAASTAAERAKLALNELIRAGGFERSTLVIITPTGTGWVDSESMDPVEYLQNGDIASVALQYSYLASWLSLLVEPDYGSESARALFREVYGYWTKMPKDHRPKLYLSGLSLGALSSEQSTELFEIIGDPYQGAVWSGPPFPSRIWRAMTAARNPGSPAWLPTVGDGSYVRFTSQTNALDLPGAHWGPMRIVYLQYASDPITFFKSSSLFTRPDWMDNPRGPDVSPEFRWYPVVTFLQLVLDMAMGTTTPMGYGHVYAGEHYIDAWREVVAPEGWSDEDIKRLKEKFRADR